MLAIVDVIESRRPSSLAKKATIYSHPILRKKTFEQYIETSFSRNITFLQSIFTVDLDSRTFTRRRFEILGIRIIIGPKLNG